MKKYVIYHGQCHDGATAAWVAWKKFGEEAEYIPATYGDEFPERIEKGSTVYIVDFSYSREVLIKKSIDMNLIVLDHHKTAKDNFVDISSSGLDFIFDMERSGAGIAWDYFFPAPDHFRPIAISLVEDRDLFKFKFIGSKPLYYVMQGYNYEFRKFDEIFTDTDETIETGKKFQEYNNSLIKTFSSQIKQFVVFDGVKMPVFELPKEFGSDVCNYYLNNCNDEYKCCAYFIQKKQNHWEWGLRSIGDFDVSLMAKKYGGGGHKNAAGFPVYTSGPYDLLFTKFAKRK